MQNLSRILPLNNLQPIWPGKSVKTSQWFSRSSRQKIRVPSRHDSFKLGTSTWSQRFPFLVFQFISFFSIIVPIITSFSLLIPAAWTFSFCPTRCWLLLSRAYNISSWVQHQHIIKAINSKWRPISKRRFWRRGGRCPAGGRRHTRSRLTWCRSASTCPCRWLSKDCLSRPVKMRADKLRKVLCVPPDHLLLYWSPNIGPLVSHWVLDKFKIVQTKALEPLKSWHFCISNFWNFFISQEDMSGPRLGALSNNRWLGFYLL